MKKIHLVTGAAGYLGCNIVRELLEAKKLVRAFVLPDDPAAKKLPRGLEIFQGDLLKKDDLRRFFSLPPSYEAVVIHSAGIVTTDMHFSQRVLTTNVQGTKNVLEQSIESKVAKLLYVSSVHALPELPKGQLITEDARAEVDEIVGFYGKTKAMATKLVLQAAREGQLDCTVVYPSGLCGPNDYQLGYVTRLLIESAKGRLPMGVKGGHDFVDVRDVAKGVICALEKGGNGQGYIMANRYVSIEEILDSVQRELGANPIKHMAPLWLARIALPFFSLYYKWSKEKPLFNRYSLHVLGNEASYCHKKAEAELDFTLRPFDETIRDSLKWLQEIGNI